MFVYNMIRKSLEDNQKNKPIKNRIKLKNNMYIHLKLNRRNASLIINSLALTKRYLYYKRVEEIPLELYFDKNNFENDMHDLELSIAKITEDCKNNFYNWKEFKIYK